MSSFLFKWLSITFAGVLLSSMITTVAAFFGWMGHEDLRDLLVLQAWSVPAAITAVILGFTVLARRCGFGDVFGTFWARLPGWLVFLVTLALSLLMIAELSFILIQRFSGDVRPWVEHVPAAAGFFSSIAVAACYVVFRLVEGSANPEQS
jgi:hypothetical protein